MIEIIDKVQNADIRAKAARRFKEKGIILPTFKQMRNPELIPGEIKDQLKNVGLWDLNPLNLFRITWKNEPKEFGGAFGGVNYIEIPKEITGIEAKVYALVGKYFPTGAHKVGAAYGCLAPRIITGQFDPETNKAVWPSTGNYCRGGAFDSYLMGCTAVAILPEEMSRERFDWLKEIGAEVYATPGCESNVKEIYDKCWEIRRTKPDHVIFNQFDEFGNSVWHYTITGSAIEEVYNKVKNDRSRFTAYISNTGSAGTIAAGDYLRTKYPHITVAASEALQCPTLLSNGFGGHRIEGIGDKHVPWIHNVKNTNVVTAIDDEHCMRAIRLLNEPVGHKYLKAQGVSDEAISQMHYLGISSVANVISAIKTAKHFDYDKDDVIITVATDSMDMYNSRMDELRQQDGEYTELQAVRDYEAVFASAATDNMKELTYQDQKAIHHLKYFTWVEQQAKDVHDLNSLWYDHELWPKLFNQAEKWDEMIEEFNEDVKKA
jgi:cysteine synthase